MLNSASKEGKAATVGGRTQWTRRALLGVVCALVIGVYAWSASSGLLELLGSGAQDSYYNLLVRGFATGISASTPRRRPTSPSTSTMTVGWTIMDCMT